MPDDAIEVFRPPCGRLTGVSVLGSGSHAPARVVTNRDLASLGCDEEWIVQRTGIHERRHVAPDEATSDLASAAARQCLEAAECPAADVDLLIVATFTPDMPVPSTACLVQDALGLRAGAMDLQAACSGFVYALTTGMQFVAAGSHRRVLVIGADANSRVVDPSDVRTYPLFGDGAGAVLLGPGDERQGAASYVLGADGSGGHLLCQRMGGSRNPPVSDALPRSEYYLHMDGRPVFKWAVRLVEDSIFQVLEDASLTMDDVDLFIPHQANLRIIHSAAESLGIGLDRVFINIDQFGNTAAASIPLALDQAVQAGRVKRGDLLLLCGFGAGLTWGTMLLRW